VKSEIREDIPGRKCRSMLIGNRESPTILRGSLTLDDYTVGRDSGDWCQGEVLSRSYDFLT